MILVKTIVGLFGYPDTIIRKRGRTLLLFVPINGKQFSRMEDSAGLSKNTGLI